MFSIVLKIPINEIDFELSSPVLTEEVISENMCL